MPSEIIKKQYVSLAKLVNIYHKQAISQLHLKVTYSFCIDIYKIATSYPDLIYSQPQLYKNQLSYSNNLIFNAVVFTCLLGVRNRLDRSAILQLMCATISLLATQEQNINLYYLSQAKTKTSPPANTPNDKLTQLLTKEHQHIWLASHALYSQIHLLNPSMLGQFNRLQSINYIGIKLALLCTPNKKFQPIKFALAFKQICILAPAHWYAYLRPLIHYPTLSPPGSLIKQNKGSVSVVLSINQQGVTAKPVNEALSKSKIQSIEARQLAQCYPSQRINDFKRLTLWWGHELDDFFIANPHVQAVLPFEKLLPIQTAPSSLLVIQDQLNNTETDISVIIKAIESEPTYIQQIQLTAKRRNRKKQAIDSIQLSLAMLGYERTSYALLEYSLLLGLNQQYFPLQERLLNFSHVFAAIAEQLASKSKLIQEEHARTAAYFLLSRLFTLPSIKKLNHWQPVQHQHFKLANLINVKDSDTLHTTGALLAQAWHQNSLIINSLKQFNETPLSTSEEQEAQLSYLLELALVISKKMYFSDCLTCVETEQYMQSVQSLIGLTGSDISEVVKLTTTKIIVRSPLVQ